MVNLPLPPRPPPTNRSVDAETSQQTLLGSHDAPVKCAEWLPSKGLLATAGWDGAIKLWDPRSSGGGGGGGGGAVASGSLPGKAYAMSAGGGGGGTLVVGTSGRHVLIYDLDKCALVLFGLF